MSSCGSNCSKSRSRSPSLELDQLNITRSDTIYDQPDAQNVRGNADYRQEQQRDCTPSNQQQSGRQRRQREQSQGEKRSVTGRQHNEDDQRTRTETKKHLKHINKESHSTSDSSMSQQHSQASCQQASVDYNREESYHTNVQQQNLDRTGFRIDLHATVPREEADRYPQHQVTPAIGDTSNCSSQQEHTPTEGTEQDFERNPNRFEPLNENETSFSHVVRDDGVERLSSDVITDSSCQSNQTQETPGQTECSQPWYQRMLHEQQVQQAQHESEKKALELELDRMTELYEDEKKRANRLMKMVLEEKSSSTAEPPYEKIVAKYESLFGTTAMAVVKASCTANPEKEDEKAHKKKTMKFLCQIFQDTYKRNKALLLDQAFSEIFTPKGTAFSPDLTKNEEDEYGHLLENFKKHPTHQPDKKVLMMDKYQEEAKKNILPPHECDGGLVELEKFVRDSSQICWAMLMVNPPMLIDTSETSLNDDTQSVQPYGVAKGFEDTAENYDPSVPIEFYKPVLYKSYTHDFPKTKGWTGIELES